MSPQEQTYCEFVIADTVRNLEEMYELDLRDRVIDNLSPEARMYLFSGYVLKEHYDCLKGKFDIVKTSNQILKDVADGFDYAG